MNDTPRTKAESFTTQEHGKVVSAEFARQLEREITESREQERIHYDNRMSVQAERDRLAAKLKHETEQAAERIADLEREHAGARNRANFFESAMREQVRLVADLRRELSEVRLERDALIESSTKQQP